MRALLLILLLLGTVCIVDSHISGAEKKEPPLVEIHQIYLVIWSCTAKIGCFGDIVRVEALRADGWADVQQCKTTREGELECDRKDRFRANLAQALSIRPYQSGRVANNEP